MDRKVIFFVIAIAGTLFLLIGCGYKSIEHGTEITQEQAGTIQPGITKKNDIILKFGDPTKTMNNDSAWFYNWTRGGKGHVLGFGSGTAYTHSLVVIFDDNNLVKDYKITRGDTEGGAGIGD